MHVEVQILHGCVDTNLAANCCKYNAALYEVETLEFETQSFLQIHILLFQNMVAQVERSTACLTIQLFRQRLSHKSV